MIFDDYPVPFLAPESIERIAMHRRSMLCSKEEWQPNILMVLRARASCFSAQDELRILTESDAAMGRANDHPVVVSSFEIGGDCFVPPSNGVSMV